MEIDKDARDVYSPEEIDAHEGQLIEQIKAASIESIPDPDAWLEETKRNILLTSFDTIIDWARRSALWPVICFPACCAAEIMAAEGPRFDLSRFGMDILRASPRQADLMITAGTLTWKMAPVVRRIYDQMPEPKWVIAMGACGISGGIFRSSYNVVPGLQQNSAGGRLCSRMPSPPRSPDLRHPAPAEKDCQSARRTGFSQA